MNPGREHRAEKSVECNQLFLLPLQHNYFLPPSLIPHELLNLHSNSLNLFLDT
jgi:hypothetical protein